MIIGGGQFLMSEVPLYGVGCASNGDPARASMRCCAARIGVGSGKDIGKDKPAFGWELEPL